MKWKGLGPHTDPCGTPHLTSSHLDLPAVTCLPTSWSCWMQKPKGSPLKLTVSLKTRWEHKKSTRALLFLCCPHINHIHLSLVIFSLWMHLLCHASAPPGGTHTHPTAWESLSVDVFPSAQSRFRLHRIILHQPQLINYAFACNVNMHATTSPRVIRL